MIGWIIFLSILVLLYLLSCIRLGGHAKYGPDGFSAAVFFGPFRIDLIPKKQESGKKKEKRPKESKPKEKPADPDAQPGDKPGILSRVMNILPDVATTLGAFKRRIRIDHLVLGIKWGAEDAASAAIGYGKANAAFGIIWPLLDNNFKVKKCEVNIGVDYGITAPEFTADAALSITIRQVLSLALYYGLKLLLKWSKSGKPSKHYQEV